MGWVGGSVGKGHATKAGPEGTGQLIRACRCWAIAMREKYGNAPRPVNERAYPTSSGSKDLPGFLAIDRDLRLQRIKSGEALLRPQPLDQGDAQMLAIEIAAEIE